jgi:hypothetical protein
MCSPNGPDAGHDKAIEQAKNAVEKAKDKVRRQCTEQDLAKLGAAIVLIGIGIGASGGAGAGGLIPALAL